MKNKKMFIFILTISFCLMFSSLIFASSKLILHEEGHYKSYYGYKHYSDDFWYFDIRNNYTLKREANKAIEGAIALKRNESREWKILSKNEIGQGGKLYYAFASNIFRDGGFKRPDPPLNYEYAADFIVYRKKNNSEQVLKKVEGKLNPSYVDIHDFNPGHNYTYNMMDKFSPILYYRHDNRLNKYIMVEPGYDYYLKLDSNTIDTAYTGSSLYYIEEKTKPLKFTNQTSTFTFNENEKSSGLIKISGGQGKLTYSTSGVPRGMTSKKVTNGYQITWKPEYSVNKNKNYSKISKSFKLTVQDTSGNSVSKNITVYVNNQPKPIDNVNNYKIISDLPVKPVDTELEKPELPVFDKDSNLADKNMFTDITNYTFVEVEEKAPYPGDEPNMIAKIKTSLVEGSNQDIHNSLSNGNVEGYKDFTNELVKYNQARDAYKNLEDLVEKQYDEQDNDELFFNNLKELIKYNNENNYLGEEIDLADYKDYDNMKALYDLLKNKLQTRQGKLDENIKQYNKYVKAVEEYNSLLENRLGLLIDNYKTDYIPKYESWKTDKENYLNNLQSKVQEYNSYNENLYNQKVEEIASSIDQYGLVSLKVNDVNQPPNLDAHYLSEVNKFDLNAIDNIYGSIKDYPYLDTEIKNSIKNKFNDGVYNEEKFDWLENTVKTNLDVSIKNSTDVNEKYLIE